MAHELSKNTSMIYNGENGVPWHGLGIQVPGLQSIMELALILPNGKPKYPELAYKVGKVPMFTKLVKVDENGDVLLGPDNNPASYWHEEDMVAIKREDTKATLGYASKQYEVIQNLDALATLVDPILAQGEGTIETAGSLFGGKLFWVLMKLPTEIKLRGDDISHQYLLFVNSHDGSSSLQIKFTSIRVVCMNTLMMALGGLGKRKRKNAEGGVLYIRHTKSATERLAKAAEVIGLSKSLTKEFAELTMNLSRREVSGAEAKDFAMSVFPTEQPEKPKPTGNEIEDARAKLQWQAECERTKEIASERAQRVLQYFEDPKLNPGADLESAKGTAWGLVNSVTRFVDYGATYRGSDSRLNNVLFDGAGVKFKEVALGTAAALLKG